MSEQQPLLPIKLEPIVEQIQNAVPQMIKGRDAAVSAMQKVQSIENDDDLANLNALLVKVRATYDKIYTLRTGITSETDKLKEFLMQFEKPLDRNGKDNEVSRCIRLIASYNQAKIDENNRVKAEAERQKQRENHKSDVIARIKKNLSDMLIQRAQEVNSGSKKFFEDTTLETWDARSKTFMSFKATLKRETYVNCFSVSYNNSLLSDIEFGSLISEVQQEETYEKWNNEVENVVMPIINDWRGRMSDIKADMDKLAKVKDEFEREKLEKEQKEKADLQERYEKDRLTYMQKEADAKIEQEKQVDKLQNDFREQAVTQQLEDAGPVKLILKFKDDKPVKALTEIIYHCFMHPKFPGIVKLDKNKQPKFDEHGMPQYIDAIDYFAQFFVKNCDVNINGIELKEVPKVIVRK